ncbi:MAG: N-acetylmuramoyl-L-alanine amidase [Dermabacter sp.]|nr:N-acetylmuramoyl-L-alanine amidase [Dermabacter sp.]
MSPLSPSRAPLSRRRFFTVGAVGVVAVPALSGVAHAEPSPDGALTSVDEAPLSGTPLEAGAADGEFRSLDVADGSMCGVTWPGEAPDEVWARMSQGGSAGEWIALEPAVDLESGQSAQGTEPLWCKDADTLHIRASRQGVDVSGELVAHIVNTEPLASDGAARLATTELETPAGEEQLDQVSGAGAAGGTSLVRADALTPRLVDGLVAAQGATLGPGAPAIISRSAWGANESLARNSGWATDLAGVVIHHTAGTNNYTRAQSAQIVRGILTYHTQSLGWADVGYNVLVDKYGQIFEGRRGGLDRLIIGAHTLGFNTGTWGVSVLGDYMRESISSAARSALVEVIAWKMLGHFRTSTTEQVRSTVTINGTRFPNGSTVSLPRLYAHRDAGYTSCPGDAFYAQIGSIRSSVEARMGAGWRLHLDAYHSGGGQAKLGTVRRSVRTEGSYHVTELTNGLVLSEGTRDPWPYITPFSAQWTAAWGRPLENPRTLAGGAVTQRFQGGIASRASAGAAVTFEDPAAQMVTGAIRDAWYRGGGQAVLGTPLALEYPIPGGAQQKFSSSVITWKQGGTAYATKGAIGSSWLGRGGAGGALGFPVGDERSLRGGATQSFEGGHLHWSPSTPAAWTSGEIYACWARHGWEGGWLGYPTADAVTGLAGGGISQAFQGGAIYAPRAGARAYAVRGGIRQIWNQNGAERGWLGYPTSEEASGQAGSAQSFTGGILLWTPGNGVRIVGTTALSNAWMAQGGPAGTLGIPLVLTPTKLADGGLEQSFTGGTMYARAGSAETFVVTGGIRACYERDGGVRGYLGYPRGNERSLRGGATQNFDNGIIHWSGAGGFSTRGAIQAYWAARGWEGGPLGYPVSDARADAGGNVSQRFQGGTLTWSASTGRVTQS